MSNQLIHDGLVAAGRTAAQSFRDLKDAESQLADGFGKPAKDTRDKLSNMVATATEEGFDVSPFRGPESVFKFPEFGAHIEIVITQIPDRLHDSVDEIDGLLERAEARVKELKARRKATIERLAIRGEIELVPQPPTLRFKQIAQS